MATMQLARVHGPSDVRLDQVPVPTPGPRDVVVRVAACGICGSDLGYIAQGGLGGGAALAEPLPIGHEFAGVVEAVGGEVAGVAPGMRVAVNPDDGFIGGGGTEGAMAPFILIPQAKLGSTLFPVADEVPLDLAALAEPLSVALHGINLVGVTAASKVAVIGAGPIGLSAVAMLRHLGVEDIAIFDREDARLERARKLGAALAVNVSGGGMADALASLHGEGVRFGTRFVGTDVFIDAAGAPAALEEAIAIAKYKARISVIALYKKPCTIDLFKVMANEIGITGSIAVERHAEFGAALDMIADGGVDLSPLISHRIGFDRFDEALAIAADSARSAKVLLTFPKE
jgi:threonine dehydrogenase-like Zn-dependent dehydrogenase